MEELNKLVDNTNLEILKTIRRLGGDEGGKSSADGPSTDDDPHFVESESEEDTSSDICHSDEVVNRRSTNFEIAGVRMQSSRLTGGQYQVVIRVPTELAPYVNKLVQCMLYYLIGLMGWAFRP